MLKALMVAVLSAAFMVTAQREERKANRDHYQGR